MRVTNTIPLGCSLLLPVGTVNSVQTLKADFAKLDSCGGTLANGTESWYNQYVGKTLTSPLSSEAGLVRVILVVCDVISVAAEFMVGSWFGSRYPGGV
jgi:hypothetical protein